MALFGKSTTKKDESKKPSEKAAIKAVKVSKAPKAKKMETKAPVVAKETRKEVAVAIPAVTSSTPVAAGSVIIGAHITEKANMQNEKNNVYTFKVLDTATKHSVAHAIKRDHKVTPTDIRFVTLPGKTIVYRGRYAFKAGFKKAYVSLKKGDKIDIA
jgi:large subunit ribosomal protein L23